MFQGTASKSIFVQCIDEGTVDFAMFSSASAHQARELFAKRGEISEAIFDLGEPPFGDLARRGTASAVVELKQHGHFLQDETESLRASYEPQPREAFFPVAASCPISAAGNRQQP